MKKLRVFLDDIRPMPMDFDKYVRTAEEAIDLIKSNSVEFISLDNDLGSGFTEGREVAKFIETEFILGNIDFVEFHPHTSNPVAWDEILACKRNVYQHYRKILKEKNKDL